LPKKDSANDLKENKNYRYVISTSSDAITLADMFAALLAINFPTSFKVPFVVADTMLGRGRLFGLGIPEDNFDIKKSFTSSDGQQCVLTGT